VKPASNTSEFIQISGDPRLGDQAAHRKRIFYLLLLLIASAAIGAYFGFPYARAQYHYRAFQQATRHRDFAEARTHLAANLEEDPNNVDTHFLMARLARQSGEFELAHDELSSCERLEGATNRIALERALLQAQQGAMSPLSERQLQIYISEGHPDSLHILEALSVGSLASYRFGRARGYLSEWIDRESDNFQPYLWRSMADERLDDSSAAMDDARQAATLAPNRFDTSFRLAEMLLLNARNAEAAEIYERLHREHPENQDIALGLAQSMLKESRLAEAAKVLDAMLADNPDNPRALLERARMALQAAEVAKAEELLQRAAKVSPWDYLIEYTLLQCLRQERKETGAIEARIKQIEDAQARFKEVDDKLKRNPNDLSIRCEIARLHLDTGNPKEAVNWLKSVLKIDPTNQQANALLADYYNKNGQPALAAPYQAAAPAGLQ
jgi:Tfp pilus assembly protein PilF